jgi:preprotein translocase SecF subunit
MKGFDFFPHNTKIPFMGWRYPTVFLSMLATLASVLLFTLVGLNFGIDFKGGSLIEVLSNSGPIQVGELRHRVDTLGLGDIQIQQIKEVSPQSACYGDKCAMLRVALQAGGDKEQQAALEKVKVALGDSVTYRNTEVVGPTVQNELFENGVIAVTTAIFGILIYVWFRFEWQFAVGAIVATIHDVALTLGIFSMLQLEFSLQIVAAVLTIVGYSLNDTVVVFDRIRENLRKYKKMPLDQLLNRAINETLSRTVLTSVTTLIAVLALFVFGGEVLRGFSFAMLWGIIVGTYSSIFIASPIVLALGVSRDWSGSGGSRLVSKETAKARP